MSCPYLRLRLLLQKTLPWYHNLNGTTFGRETLSIRNLVHLLELSKWFSYPVVEWGLVCYLGANVGELAELTVCRHHSCSRMFYFSRVLGGFWIVSTLQFSVDLQCLPAVFTDCSLSEYPPFFCLQMCTLHCLHPVFSF